jgi:hypothetical protein
MRCFAGECILASFGVAPDYDANNTTRVEYSKVIAACKS